MRWLWRTTFAVALLAIIAGSLLLSDAAVPDEISSRDKTVHLVAYFGLGLLAALGWPRWKGVALIGLPLVGLAVEVAQRQVGRHFDWGDALANAAGIGAGVTVAALIVSLLERKAR
jgi:VanZ family protein